MLICIFSMRYTSKSNGPSNEEILIRFEEKEDRLVIEIIATIEETKDEGYTLHHQIMETLLDDVEVEAGRLLLTKVL